MVKNRHTCLRHVDGSKNRTYTAKFLLSKKKWFDCFKNYYENQSNEYSVQFSCLNIKKLSLKKKKKNEKLETKVFLGEITMKGGKG